MRTETGIGERQLSMSSVAVALARELLGELDGREVVIIGAGETSELTARALADSGGRHDVRGQPPRATARSAWPGATAAAAVSFDELPQALDAGRHRGRPPPPRRTCCSRRGELAEVMEARGGRPLLLIDLAVPRDIDAGVRELDGISLYDIDDLQAVIVRNRQVRQAEARRAEGIVEEEIQHFAAWLGSLEVLPTIAALRDPGHRDRRAGGGGEQRQWESASPRDLERVDAIARAMVNRLLHEPTLRMKELRDDRVHARMAARARAVRPRS